jgi:hypothetical protein
MEILAAIIELVKTAGVPGAIALVIILRIEPRLDALTAAVLSVPERLNQCQSPPKSEPPASTPPT